VAKIKCLIFGQSKFGFGRGSHPFGFEKEAQTKLKNEMCRPFNYNKDFAHVHMQNESINH
jgi:hypothetical protein